MNRYLILRLSSMGDVLLTLPVIRGILDHNPGIQLLFVTNRNFIPYFKGIPRLTLIGYDPGNRNQGIAGILRLFNEIRGYQFESVIDLHGVLRTWILDGLLLIFGHKVFTVSKHRKIRRRILTERMNTISVPRTVDRYSIVFEKAGLRGGISENPGQFEHITSLSGKENGKVIRIGIAPLSRHSTKNWGLDNVQKLISLLQDHYQLEIHLFGGKEDRIELSGLTGAGIFNHAGETAPAEEISLIRTMNAFVSMDSANMHLASIIGVPVISVWGATDPRLGFGPLYQPDDFAIYADPNQVTCRPCSVYGEKPCVRTDSPMICMHSISPNQVMNKLIKILSRSENNVVSV